MKIHLFLFVLLFSGAIPMSIYAQDYHLVYETHDYIYMKNIRTPENTITTKVSFDKGYLHILAFKNKAIRFQEDSIKFKKDISTKNINESKILTVIDKKNRKIQTVSAFYNTKAQKVIINSYNKNDWSAIDPLIKPDVDSSELSFITKLYKDNHQELLDSFPEWQAPRYTYSNESKIINDYTCKKVEVFEHQKTYDVWYTEELSYNWCFDDYRYLIPGTIIQIERDNEIFLKLLNIEELDYKILPVREEVIDKLKKLR